MHVEIAQCSGCGRQKCRLKVVREKDSFWFTCTECDSKFKKHLELIDAQCEIERLHDRITLLKKEQNDG